MPGKELSKTLLLPASIVPSHAPYECSSRVFLDEIGRATLERLNGSIPVCVKLKNEKPVTPLACDLFERCEPGGPIPSGCQNFKKNLNQV